MSEMMNSMSLKDMNEFKRYSKHGYTIVNDYELPDDGWGFDITKRSNATSKYSTMIWEILKNT